MPRKRKGVSTIIGASIFVGILLLAFSSFQYFMRDLNALSDSAATMAILDDERRKELLAIDEIILGSVYSNSTDLSATSASGGTLYPVTNMNFTDNADGWAFSAQLYNPGDPYPSPPAPLTSGDDDGDGLTTDDAVLSAPSANGVLPDGGFNAGWSSSAVTSNSGAGSIYTHFSFIDSNNANEGGAIMTWTYKFTLDATTAAAIQDADFSMGFYIPDERRVNGPAGTSAVIFYTITDPGGVTHAIEIDEQGGTLSWNNFHVPSSRLVPSLSWTAGEYKLQLSVMVDIRAETPAYNSAAEIFVHFDDVGVKLNLGSSGYSINLSNYGDFNVSSPETVSNLDFTIQASSNATATQYFYLYDFVRQQWTLELVSTVSTTTSIAGLVLDSPDIPRFAAQFAGDYTVDPGVTQTVGAGDIGDVWIRIYVVGTAPFTYSATVGLDTQMLDNDEISFVVSNNGGITGHIVRFWILTGAETKAVNVDTYVDPGRSITLSQDIAPTTGTVEIRIITERGSIFSLKENV